MGGGTVNLCVVPLREKRSLGLATTSQNSLMKTSRQPFGIFLILTFGVLFQTHAQNPFTNGLVAYYPLNGNANDASGNGRHGTAINGVSYLPDRSVSVAYFNGNSQYISLPNTISNYQDLTVTFWVKTSASDPNGFPYGLYLVSRDISGYYNDWNLCMGLGRKIEFDNGGNVLASPNDIASNQWVQVACVADSASQLRKIFLNGQQAASKSWSPAPFVNNSVPILLGASISDTASHAFFTGRLADVRFYNRALSISEVQQLYAYESAYPCTPHAATATAILVNNFVVDATITDAGCGYTNAPTVLIQGGGGTGATATATISNGFVTVINITDAGCCYTNPPKIVIGSPPFVPTVGIAVSKVKVTQNVVLGRKYVLEASTDLVTWTATGPPFTADSETIVTEFDIDVTVRFFRLREVP